ncbi:MAG: FAD-binding oxidoreductase [Alphaproteobacteria bacterium]|nr:FAD-binding oxidoreductase [Alphaproteobacteria bacterium]
MAALATDPDLLAALAAIVGPAHVATDEGARGLASSDLFVWPEQVLAEAVVRPGSTDEVAAVARLLAERRRAIVPRGAGMSYTGAVVPTSPAIVLDLARLDRIDVHAADLYAVVGAGCSWARLAEALQPHGLRPAQINPISGAVSTVGGTAAQNIPGGSDGFIGATVVLADGTIARTGAGARAGAAPFWRYHGPDLTGLFLGDCGAFGVKTELVLRLVPERPAAMASFGFQTAEDMLAALVAIQTRGLVSRALAMDPLKNRDAKKMDTAEAVKTIGAVVAKAASVGQAIRDVAQMARGRSALDDVPWSLHLTAEAGTEAAAEAQIALARAVCLPKAREIEPVVPKALRAKPYSIRGFVGPDGERWVPVHGVLPLSRAQACFGALRAAIGAADPELDRAGISVSYLVSSAGAYVTIEPMFYWRDALDPIHMQHLSERNRTRFGGAAPNEAARTLIRRLRRDLVAVMDAHDAVHAQIGRFYDFANVMDTGSRNLVERIKAALDPEGRMNPGSLGL